MMSCSPTLAAWLASIRGQCNMNVGPIWASNGWVGWVWFCSSLAWWYRPGIANRHARGHWKVVWMLRPVSVKIQWGHIQTLIVDLHGMHNQRVCWACPALGQCNWNTTGWLLVSDKVMWSSSSSDLVLDSTFSDLLLDSRLESDVSSSQKWLGMMQSNLHTIPIQEFDGSQCLILWISIPLSHPFILQKISKIYMANVHIPM